MVLPGFSSLCSLLFHMPFRCKGKGSLWSQFPEVKPSEFFLYVWWHDLATLVLHLCCNRCSYHTMLPFLCSWCDEIVMYEHVWLYLKKFMKKSESNVTFLDAKIWNQFIDFKRMSIFPELFEESVLWMTFAMANHHYSTSRLSLLAGYLVKLLFYSGKFTI